MLQLWPRTTWEAFLAQSRGMHNWDNPCWHREQLAVPDGQATLFSGHTSVMVSLPPGPPPNQPCPNRPYDTFVAHAYLDQAVVFVTLMARAPSPSTSATNPYDTRESIELLVRSLRRR